MTTKPQDANTRTTVWIDHREARVFHVTAETFDETHVKSPHHVSTKQPDAKHFYHDVARALASSHHILVVGPAKAKLELLRHLHAHDRAIEACVVGVETVDHPTDHQLVAFTRDYFQLHA